MMRMFGLALAGLLALAQPLNAAGTVPGFSLTPQFDSTGKVMPGCKLYVIQAGTTQTPQNSYQDSALTILQPNPLVCDATGRLPQWFVADGQIKVRLTNALGIQQFVGDNLLVVGASSGGGGGGGTVDPTTIMATGDLKPRYGTGVLTGFVRANGRTIGSATSGATERANADCQALFEYLWGADPNLAVSTGRGASANADWVANKTISLPDMRGRVIAGMDDMGSSAAGRLTSSYFGVTSGASGTALGGVGGIEGQTLSMAQLPASPPPITTQAGYSYGKFNINSTGPVVAGSGFTLITGWDDGVPTATLRTQNLVMGNLGSGAAHPSVQPTMVATIYLKL